MKRIFALVIALMLMLTAFAAAEEFRVGLECNYAPFNWTQVEEDELSVAIDGGMGFAGGYDVEIAKRIAEELEKLVTVIRDEILPRVR